MFKGLVVVAWRNLYLNYRFSLINIAGLSVGIACCILMLLFVFYESSYDSSYTGSDRIYKVAMDPLAGARDEAPRNQLMAFPERLMDLLLPGSGSGEVELASYYSLFDGNQLMVSFEGRLFHDEFVSVGEDFFQIIDVNFIEGSAEYSFKEPGGIVMTESKARAYFGGRAALGRTLVTQEGGLLVVTGIVKDFPENSHIKRDIFVGPKALEIMQGPRLVDVINATGLLVRLADKVEPDHVLSSLSDSWERFYGSESNANFRLIPISDVHLSDPAIKLMTSDGNNSWSLSNRVVLSVAAVLALLILAIAIFNFVNMSVARASQRGREIGVRKVFGATRGQLFGQYLCEAVVLAVLATIVALILVWLLLPWFNFIVSRTLTLPSLTDLCAMAGLLVLTLGVGFLAGVYPAVVMSRQSPVAAIRGGKSTGSQGVLRKTLVITQFSAATLLIVISLMGWQQLELFRHQDLGYNKDVYLLKPNMRSLQIYMGIQREQSGENSAPDTWDLVSLRLQAELLKQPAISDVSLSWLVPGIRTSGDIEMARSGDGEQQYVPVGISNSVDENFQAVYELPLLAGRNFSRKQPLDAGPLIDPKKWRSDRVGGAIILAQSTAKALGFRSPQDAIDQKVLVRSPLRDYEVQRQKKLGVHVPRPSTPHHVIGVVGDMLLGDGIGGMSTAAFTFGANGGNSFSIKVRLGKDKEALEQIQAVIKKAAPGILFDVEYLPEKLERSLQPFNRLMLAFIGFAILAVGISCLGLYAMATFTVARRIKEVGVRKVLGASSGRLVRLLGWDFTKPVLLAIALALPLAYIVCTYMLQAFAHKVPVGIALLGTSALLSVVIAWLTVSGQTWLAANANPAESLRSE